MALEKINPNGLPVPESYTHAVVATGTRTVYVAGQVAEDADGNLVAPGDLAGQARQAFANLGVVLAAAGARPDQVARITIYVVGHRPELLDAVRPARDALFGDHLPADTYLGVETLAEEGRLIEVEAIAVLD
jgi:enamine deaminase RidA (YjgF/YER057c/UK114 family)